MADVKWIKITTNIFDDEKIRVIETMPEGDTIIVIWFKLLCLAGKTNANGYFMLNDEIAYTEEMLVAILNRPLRVVKLALDTFKAYKMIEVIDNILCLPNWEKHQNIEGLDKIREQGKIRQQRYRNKQKQLLLNNKELEIDLEEDIDIEKDRYNNVTVTLRKVVKYLNDKLGAKYKTSTPKTRELITARINEGFTYDDFIIVIDKKVKEWAGTDMDKYLRPITLFSNKFEGYLNQIETINKPKQAGSFSDLEFDEEGNLIER